MLKPYARIWTALSVALILVSACGSQTQPREAVGAGTSQAPPAADQPRGPKSVTIAIQREPVSFEPEISGAAGSSTAGAASRSLLDRGLSGPAPTPRSRRRRPQPESPTIGRTWEPPPAVLLPAAPEISGSKLTGSR